MRYEIYKNCKNFNKKFDRIVSTDRIGTVRRPPQRKPRGMMLALTSAISATVLVSLLFFFLRTAQVTAGYGEQRSQIEAAALAAAKDMGSIVINDPHFGYIGLSDSAPVGQNTLAADGFAMPVTGINTLLANVRLDLYLADSFGDQIMQQRAAEDYRYAVTARNNLVAAMNQAISRQTITDMNGKQLNIMQDAIAAYNSNSTHIAGGKSNYMVPNSMKLALGCIPNAANTVGSASAVPVPQPAGVADVQSSQQVGGLYAAFVDIPYQSKGPAGTAHFAFAGTSDGIRLVDPQSFATTAANLPDPQLLIPSVILCQADQHFVDHDQMGRSIDRTIHMAAAAECCCAFMPAPHPGALTFSFPNGVPPELTTPLFLYSDPAHILNWSPVDIFEQPPQNSDYPEAPMCQTTVPYWTGKHPRLTKPVSLALYDWLRTSGPAINLPNLLSWLQTPVFTETDSPTIYSFEFTPANNPGTAGTVLTTTKTSCPKILSRRVSSSQWVAIAGGAMRSTNGNFYDLIIKDDVYNLGLQTGGIHGGQPLGNQIPPAAQAAGGSTGGVPTPLLVINEPQPADGEYPYPASHNSNVRPTYKTPGQAVDIRFRFTGYPWTDVPRPGT